MSDPRYPTPDSSISHEERAVFRRLGPLRQTLETYVRSMHARMPGSNEHLLKADTEVLWTLVLAAYTRGVGNLRTGLHKSEGVDHEMLDQAIQFAIQKGTDAP